ASTGTWGRSGKSCLTPPRRRPGSAATGVRSNLARAWQPKVAKADWKRPTRARVRAFRDRLREMYGRPVNLPHRQPIDELVRTILSQATSDANRDRAFARLKERFDDWESVR